MAKNAKQDATPAQAEGASFTISLPVMELTAQGEAYRINGETPVATLVYLLTNGFVQSVTDAYTSAAAKHRNDLAEAAGVTGKEAVKAFAASESVAPLIAAAGKDGAMKRVAALVAGTMVAGSRGPSGPRRTGFDAFAWGQAKLFLDGRAKATGKALPKGDDLQALMEQVIARNTANYRALYDAQNGADDDLTW